MATVKVQFKTQVTLDGKREPAGKIHAMEEKIAMVHVNAGRAVLVEKGDAPRTANAAAKAAKAKADKEAAQKAAAAPTDTAAPTGAGK